MAQLPYHETKPPCPEDPSHGVVARRLIGTFKHHWFCMSCLVNFACAPDRDPDERERFEY